MYHDANIDCKTLSELFDLGDTRKPISSDVLAITVNPCFIFTTHETPEKRNISWLFKNPLILYVALYILYAATP